jgi:hypothetical protein
METTTTNIGVTKVGKVRVDQTKLYGTAMVLLVRHVCFGLFTFKSSLSDIADSYQFESLTLTFCFSCSNPYYPIRVVWLHGHLSSS